MHVIGTVTLKPTGPQKTQQRAVNVVAIPFSLYHKVNHPEVATLDDQRTPRGGKGELFHRRYVVMQNLQTSIGAKERKDRVDDLQGIVLDQVLICFYLFTLA